MVAAITPQSASFETPGRLVSLEVHHVEALETFLSEFDSTPDELHGYFCHRDDSIEHAVALLRAWNNGERLAEGRVPNSTWFWEVDGTLRAVINLRHRLTPLLEQDGGHIGYAVASSHRQQGIATAMLGSVLGQCRGLGIQRTLLICASDNLASIRTIEKHGGVLDGEGQSQFSQGKQRWYWIDLSRT
jgi:predicted acetyltransferase